MSLFCESNDSRWIEVRFAYQTKLEGSAINKKLKVIRLNLRIEIQGGRSKRLRHHEGLFRYPCYVTLLHYMHKKFLVAHGNFSAVMQQKATLRATNCPKNTESKWIRVYFAPVILGQNSCCGARILAYFIVSQSLQHVLGTKLPFLLKTYIMSRFLQHFHGDEISPDQLDILCNICS